MWKDITTYSRSDDERKPTTFQINESVLRIVITCGHIYYAPQWVMHCNLLGIDTHLLSKSLTKEQAEAEAIEIVFDKLNDLIKCVEIIKNDFKN